MERIHKKLEVPSFGRWGERKWVLLNGEPCDFHMNPVKLVLSWGGVADWCGAPVSSRWWKPLQTDTCVEVQPLKRCTQLKFSESHEPARSYVSWGETPYSEKSVFYLRTRQNGAGRMGFRDRKSGLKITCSAPNPYLYDAFDRKLFGRLEKIWRTAPRNSKITDRYPSLRIVLI